MRRTAKDDIEDAERRAAGRRPAAPRGWPVGWPYVTCAALVALLLLFPGALPNAPGRAGSLLETFLPWLGLAVPLLLMTALLRRSAHALCVALAPALAWLVAFGGLLLPPPQTDGAGANAKTRAYDGITALQHNVSDENPDPRATARALLKADADVIALQELTAGHVREFGAVLAAEYPHHAVAGTVGLWSRHPLTGTRPLDIRPQGVGPGWNRGLRAVARTPDGDMAVYVAHLPSVRLGAQGLGSARRDESARLLGAALAAERTDKVVLLGDLNSTVDDRGLAPVTDQLNVPARGFAFSWPASFPVARIDQILARGGTVTRIWPLPRTPSDHLPVAARITFD